MEEAIDEYDQRLDELGEIDAEIEQAYDYSKLKEEIAELKSAIDAYMIDADMTSVDRPTFRLTVIRAKTKYWNPDKLKKLVGKGTFIQVCKYVVDSEKIDDLVRSGKIEADRISPALEEIPKKPFVRRFEKSGDASQEEKDLIEAMR